jgi:hypothetical protein
LTVQCGGEFSVSSVDPSQPLAPPPALTQADAPSVSQAIAAGDQISLMISDDVFNQIFYKLKQEGKLTAFCSAADGLHVEDLLPKAIDGGCDSINLATDIATATARGLCHGARLHDCEALDGGGPVRTATEQGACHGIKHDDCTTIAVSGVVLLADTEKGACGLAKNINVLASDSILVCGRLDAEPDLLFKNKAATDNSVDTDLILNDLNIAFVLDRANDGYTGKLEDLLGCLSKNGSAAGDCQLYSACLDLTLHSKMRLDNTGCSPTETGFAFALNGPPTKTGFDGGVLCSAGTPTSDQLVVKTGVDSNATQAVANAAPKFAPPICIDGLTLGGNLSFQGADAKLFAITTTGAEPGFADFIGLTGALVP